METEQDMTSAGYDSETVMLLRGILEASWERLTAEQQAQTQKSEVALRILQLARQGERDPMRLRAGAVTGVIAETETLVEVREFAPVRRAERYTSAGPIRRSASKALLRSSGRQPTKNGPRPHSG
jgi:hypothetical protein